MTSQVINGVALGTGATHIRTLYHNTTGGNVRILWNFVYVGYKNGGNQKLLDLGLTQAEATALTGYTPPTEE